ncbi:MAG: hypothetical protein JSS21_08345 [Proteobacteria bacterium]|nr:hypothetical protein [Pseudomonadota bacterium]
MHRRSLPVGFVLVALLALAACNRNREPAAPPTTTPEGAVRAGLVLTRNGDFDGLQRSTLPEADYNAWRAQWERARAAQPAPTPQQRAQFAQMMQKLTEPGAEEKLYKQLQPQLADLRAHRDQNLPMLIGILQAAGTHVVAEAGGLSPAQKQQATQAIDALADWARGADFTDADKARQAIALVCGTARQLDLKTLDQARALDYTQSMARYRTAWDGLKALLKLYGLDLDASFDQARLETLANDGRHARVRETFQLAGKSIVSQINLVQQAGHWYDADRLAAWRASRPTPAPAGSKPPPPPSSVSPAPAGSAAPATAR